MVIKKFDCIGIIIFLLLSACSSVYYYSHYEITKEDIPLYPNAKNIQTEEVKSTDEYYYWKFTTIDNPNKVWDYYREYFNSRWDISDGTNIEKNIYSLSVVSCPFYTLKMEVISSTPNNYEITLIFQKEFCR